MVTDKLSRIVSRYVRRNRIHLRRDDRRLRRSADHYSRRSPTLNLKLRRVVLIAPTAIYLAVFGLTARAEPLTGLDVTVYDYRTDGNDYNSSPPLPTNSTPIAGTLVAESISHSFDYEPWFDLYEDFVVRYVGHITAPATGPISFIPLADDGIKLYIDGVLVVDDWYDKGGGGSTSPEIIFEAGESKPIELYFYENGGGAWLHLYWNLGEEWQIVPASAFTRDPVTSTTTTSTVSETTIPETTIPETTTTTSSSSTTTTTTTTAPAPVWIPPATTSSTTTSTVSETTIPEPSTTLPPTTLPPTTVPAPSTSLREPSPEPTDAPEPVSATPITPETLLEAPSEPSEPISLQPSQASPAEIVNALSNPETVAGLTPEQATELFAQLDPAELTQQLADRLVDALADAPEAVREAFEEEIDVYSGLFDRYVPVGSTVPVSTRRTLVAVSGLALATAASVRIRR